MKYLLLTILLRERLAKTAFNTGFRTAGNSLIGLIRLNIRHIEMLPKKGNKWKHDRHGGTDMALSQVFLLCNLKESNIFE
jgi:hypothetical protein